MSVAQVLAFVLIVQVALAAGYDLFICWTSGPDFSVRTAVQNLGKEVPQLQLAVIVLVAYLFGK